MQECLVNTELREALLVNIQMSILTDFTDYWQLLKSKNPQINSNLSGMDVIRTNAGLLFAYFAQRFILNIPTLSQADDLILIEKQILSLLTLK